MKSNSGNVLFIILIAVALFAALSYAVTSSSNGGGAPISKDTAQANAAMTIQYGTGVAGNVLRKRLANGIPDTGWEPDVLFTGWGSTCDTKDCMIFDGIPLNPFPPKFYSSVPGEGASIITVRIIGVGNDDKAEIALVIQSLRQDTCEAINRNLGITNLYPLDPYSRAQYRDINTVNPVFPEPPVSANGDIGDDITELKGKTSMCVRDGLFGNNRANYIHVLIER